MFQSVVFHAVGPTAFYDFIKIILHIIRCRSQRVCLIAVVGEEFDMHKADFLVGVVRVVGEFFVCLLE